VSKSTRVGKVYDRTRSGDRRPSPTHPSFRPQLVDSRQSTQYLCPVEHMNSQRPRAMPAVVSTLTSAGFLNAPLRPAWRFPSHPVPRLPIRTRNLSQADKTITKSRQTTHPDLTISRKTLDRRLMLPLKKNSAATRSIHPSDQSGRKSLQVTSIAQLCSADPEPGWTRLNEPEHPEQPMSHKTLGIAPPTAPTEIFGRTPEHRAVPRMRFSRFLERRTAPQGGIDWRRRKPMSRGDCDDPEYLPDV
jgi:hypothetical protein